MTADPASSAAAAILAVPTASEARPGRPLVPSVLERTARHGAQCRRRLGLLSISGL